MGLERERESSDKDLRGQEGNLSPGEKLLWTSKVLAMKSERDSCSSLNLMGSSCQKFKSQADDNGGDQVHYVVCTDGLDLFENPMLF